MSYSNDTAFLPKQLIRAPDLNVNFIFDKKVGALNYFYILSERNGEMNSFHNSEIVVSLLKKTKNKINSETLINELSSRYDKKAIREALFGLFSSTAIVDANYQMSNDYASFWLEHQIVPIKAEQRLNHCLVGYINYSKNLEVPIQLEKAAHAVGLALTQEIDNCNLLLVLVDDYLQPELDNINQKYYQKKSWLPLHLSGITPMLGPIFNQETQHFCYQCLYKRIRENRQIYNLLGRYRQNAELIEPNFTDSNALFSVAYQFILVVAQYIVLGKSHLINQIQRYHWHNQKSDYHQVCQIPQCHFCGKPQHSKPVAFVFDKPEHSLITSGGYKSKSPLKTLADYEHLVSPISGVVSTLRLISKEDDDWEHVYESGNNIALKSDNLSLSLVSIRMLNAGKGETRVQAKASALAESIERYCSAYQGDEVYKHTRFIDFDKGEAMLPNVFMHYSERQYNNADKTNAQMSNFHHTPKKINSSTVYDWSPIWSLLEEKHIWVPTQLLYFGYPYGEDWIASADTNGTASGNSKSEAFVQAFLELIERDNVAIWWHNCLQYRHVDLKSFPSEHIREAAEIHKKRYNRRLYAIDITSDTNIPTFVVISHLDTDAEDSQQVCFASASHFDANIAMLRAICEHTQLLVMIKNNYQQGAVKRLSHEFAYWLEHSNVVDKKFNYLLPNDDTPAVFADYAKAPPSLLRQKSACLQLVKTKGWQIYIADLTRADINMPVIKVMIPQLRSMHTRLGPGRLYDVPVQMGWLKKALKEEELNKIAIFI